MGMDQYLYIPFLGGWTSIYQPFWCSPGVQGFDTLPHVYVKKIVAASRFFGADLKIPEPITTSSPQYGLKPVPVRYLGLDRSFRVTGATAPPEHAPWERPENLTPSENHDSKAISQLEEWDIGGSSFKLWDESLKPTIWSMKTGRQKAISRIKQARRSKATRNPKKKLILKHRKSGSKDKWKCKSKVRKETKKIGGREKKILASRVGIRIHLESRC